MSRIVACTRCSERFSRGQTDAVLCGVCLPRGADVDWRAVPTRSQARLREAVVEAEETAAEEVS